MNKTGYIDEAVDHPSCMETIYRDADSEWVNLSCPVSISGLSTTEHDIIKAQAKTFLEKFLKTKKMKSQDLFFKK